MINISEQFHTFDLEDNLDILEIWDGGSTLLTSQKIARVSGDSLGKYESYISSRNHLILRFLTDSSVEKEGFSFSWSTGIYDDSYYVLFWKILSHLFARCFALYNYLGSNSTCS